MISGPWSKSDHEHFNNQIRKRYSSASTLGHTLHILSSGMDFLIFCLRCHSPVTLRFLYLFHP